jgi:hypothetical protein
MRVLLPLLLALIPAAHAEYRAFELVITNPTSGQEHVMISTLDPNQFRRYYPVKSDESVAYRATWMCRGNTSAYKAVCPKPEKKN